MGITEERCSSRKVLHANRLFCTVSALAESLRRKCCRAIRKTGTRGRPATRIGCLQLMRHLLLYGRRSVKPAGQSEKLIGELALLTNDYLQLEAIQNPSRPETLELLLSFLPMWDVYNPRELAYA